MNKNKSGKKNEFEGPGTTSVLNFDITGDVTREFTDIEALGTAAQTPARDIQVPKNSTLAIVHRNSTSSNFVDPMTQASNREKIILTEDKDAVTNRKKELDDHVRKVSHLTHPQGSAIEEVKEDSLHSYQFSGSQFRSPSDAAENNKPD